MAVHDTARVEDSELGDVAVGENAVVGAGTTVPADVPAEAVVRAASDRSSRSL